MSDCQERGLFGQLLCKFEARYDESEPILPAAGFKADHFNPNHWKRKTYVRDVCTKCGKTIERTK